MHCGSVQIDCRRCLRAKVSSLSVEIQRGDVVFTAYAYKHGAVLNPFGCVVSHTLDCSPCSPRNNAALRWPIEGNTWLTGTAGTVGWRSGCADCDFVSTWSGMHRGCDAGSDFSGASSQRVRYRQGRRGICTHTVVAGSSVSFNRPGIVLAGVLASGITAEILSPAFDSDRRRITRTPHEGIVFQGMRQFGNCVVKFPQSVVFGA